MNIEKILFGEHAKRNGITLILVGLLITAIATECGNIDISTLTTFQLGIRIVLYIIGMLMITIEGLIVITVTHAERKLKQEEQKVIE